MGKLPGFHNMVLISVMIQYTISLSNMVCCKIPYLVWCLSHFKSRWVREIPIASHVWYSRIAYPEIPHFRTHQSLLGEGKGQLHGAGSVISFSWGYLRAITVEKCIASVGSCRFCGKSTPADCGRCIEHVGCEQWTLKHFLCSKFSVRTAADSTWFAAVEVVSPWLFGVQARYGVRTVNDHLLPWLSNKQLHRFSFDLITKWIAKRFKSHQYGLYMFIWIYIYIYMFIYIYGCFCFTVFVHE